MVLPYQMLRLTEKATPQKPLHRHCKRRFLYILSCLSHTISLPHPPKSVVIIFLWSMNCVLRKCSIFYHFCYFSSSTESMSGCSIVAFIAAGRKTFIGEKCECSSSKENGGAPEKLITGNFSKVFVSGLALQLRDFNSMLPVETFDIMCLQLHQIEKKKFTWSQAENIWVDGDVSMHITIYGFAIRMLGLNSYWFVTFLVFSLCWCPQPPSSKK